MAQAVRARRRRLHGVLHDVRDDLRGDDLDARDGGELLHLLVGLVRRAMEGPWDGLRQF